MLTLAASIWTESFLGIFKVWQIPIFVALIVLLFFWKSYRNKQM